MVHLKDYNVHEHLSISLIIVLFIIYVVFKEIILFANVMTIESSRLQSK